MREKFPLVCVDRDGTILKDDGNLYLGRTEDWRKKVEFLPYVADGIKELNRNEIYPVIITNQSGVALIGKEFDELTEDRMHETCVHIIKKLAGKRAAVGGYFACPFVSSRYANGATLKGRKVNKKYIDNRCRDLKPNIGMVEKAAMLFHRSLDDCSVFVVGDRFSDVQTGLNAGGVGILVPGVRKEDIKFAEEAACCNPGRIYIAENFLDACRYAVRKIY